MKIVLLASGSGSLAQAIIDAKSASELELEILAVLSDRDSEVLIRATSAGINTKHLPMTPCFDSLHTWHAYRL
jgi:phosphoribosylglycinamide formyltransferase-1